MRYCKQKYLKIQHDGRVMLNLACGSKMNNEWNNIDNSPLILFAKHSNAARFMNRIGLLSMKRYNRLQNINNNIIRWDLRKGIPFEANTFDVVYHSHFLEHIDPSSVTKFLKDCHRVLKATGIIRIVVPDLEVRCKNYIDSLNNCDLGISKIALEKHKESIHRLLGQMVVSDAPGLSKNNYFLSIVEGAIRGKTDKTGDIHRWMYDRITLKNVLEESGFSDVAIASPNRSRIEGWQRYLLDTNEDGTVYKRDSIYLEATKLKQ